MASSDDDDIVALVGVLYATELIKKKRKKRTEWTKTWLKKRRVHSHINLLSEIKFWPKDWHNYLRMDEATYLHLLSLVGPIIKKTDTVMREAITPHERLTATLRFLATGRNYEDLKFSTIISPQALGHIIPETCDAIYKVLHNRYLKFPRTEEEWRKIAEGFEDRWDFPHCLGAIDGKHVEIVPPNGSGSLFYNYKGGHSMVLLAVVDATYKYIMCDFGTNGRVSDGGVLQNTKFGEKLNSNLLNIPAEKLVGNRSLPYVFVADDAFPLRLDMIKPFRQAELVSRERKIYNYRVSRARRIVENAFGIMSSRFRIFHTKISLHPNNTDSVVMAACALHNFLIDEVPNSYSPLECFDHENREDGTITLGLNTHHSQMQGLNKTNRGNSPQAAKKVREDFMNYFVNEGKVEWQDEFIS